jgi:hypothetical protein
MIVRIFTEGQYRIPDAAQDRLRELDRATHAAIEADDEEGYQRSYRELLELIRSEGEPLADDDLSNSDLMLPPPDTTLAEVKAEFTGEGLIPD